MKIIAFLIFKAIFMSVKTAFTVSKSDYNTLLFFCQYKFYVNFCQYRIFVFLNEAVTGKESAYAAAVKNKSFGK